MLFELFLIWIVLFLGNVIISCFTREDNYDKIFRNREYTYENVLARIELIEKYFNRNLTSAKKALLRYKRNAQASRRKFKYYAPIIEPALLDILSNHEKGEWNFFWRKSSLLTKAHLFYVLIIPTVFFLGIQYAFLTDGLEMPFLVALPALILFVLGVTAYVLIINSFFYLYIIWFLELFNFESGVLNRNVVAYGAVSKSFKFYRRSAIIMAASGAITTFWSKIGAFKGLGGGKFGGGGAGGSW